MKQEKIDELMNKIDRKCKFPKHWDEFIKENSKEHHIIIKDKETKKLYCSYCNRYFTDEKIKVRDYVECPHCHKKSRVYGKNYYRTSFIQPVVLVQRMNKQIIIRIFEIYSYFEEGKKRIKTHCIEYARILPGIGRFIGNNVYISMYGAMYVYHGYKTLNWSAYKGYKFLTDHPTYPYNKKRLVKGTNIEYAPIKEFMQKFSYYRYNYLDVLELAAYESFEILWNMKLYKLCFHSKALNKNGSFYKRFKVPKTFLKFMQDNDVSYKELMLLQLFQKNDNEILQKYRYSNINHIRFLFKHDLLETFEKYRINIDKNTIKILKNIQNFVPLKKLKNYPKGLMNLNIYNDYLNMSKELALNYKSKKDLFPRNLIARHDKIQTKIKVTEDMNTQFKVYLRYLELSKYTYDDNKYIIFPAPSIDDMKNEGTQQDNCVAYMYLNPYKDGETEIFFIRKLEDVTKSFITLEYKDGCVVQKELSHHNKNFTNEQLTFIDKWLGFRNFIDLKEKHKAKTEIKIKKYNLNQLVA